MALLAAMYVGGVADPRGNLHGFPIAIVVNDDGDTLPNGTTANFGHQIADAVVGGLDSTQFDVRRLGPGQVREQLADGKLYGAVVIPSDFTKRSLNLAAGSVVPGTVVKPTITVVTNPRASTLSQSVVTTVATTAITRASATLGDRLVQNVLVQLRAADPTARITAASQVALADPIQMVVAPSDPLPDGTGFGLTAFYYALLLLLAGFTGAMIISSLVDSRLMFVPLELGPTYTMTPLRNPPTRLDTLYIKWAIVLAIAPVVSAVYIGVCRLVGMPIPNSWLLWMFGALAIAAVGITATSVISVFGSAGLIINLIFFVVLGLPSAGATIPLEATPRFLVGLASFEPLHQIFLGVRAILHYYGRLDAGLLRGVEMSLLGLVAGGLFGWVITWFYDRKGWVRAASDQS